MPITILKGDWRANHLFHPLPSSNHIECLNSTQAYTWNRCSAYWLFHHPITSLQQLACPAYTWNYLPEMFCLIIQSDLGLFSKQNIPPGTSFTIQCMDHSHLNMIDCIVSMHNIGSTELQFFFLKACGACCSSPCFLLCTHTHVLLLPDIFAFRTKNHRTFMVFV